MPTFEGIYPDVPEHFESREYPIMVKFAEYHECEICHRPTRWIEISFEAYICSDECYDCIWKEYEDACREVDERDRDREASGGVS